MSELRANTISDAAGTGPVTLTGQSAAKAWVNFNGTGTIAIGDDYNVSSLTDNGTGDTSINLNNSMSASTYTQSAVSDLTIGSNNNVPPVNYETRTTGAMRVQTVSAVAASQDHEYVAGMIWGDLA